MGRLTAPREVLRELERGRPDIYAWARAQGIFVDIYDPQIATAREIQRRFDLTDSGATGPVADELIVALPLSPTSGSLLPSDTYIVVTQESSRGRWFGEDPECL